MKKALIFVTLLIITTLIGCSLSTTQNETTTEFNSVSSSDTSTTNNEVTTSSENNSTSSTSESITTVLETTTETVTLPTTEVTYDRFQDIYLYSLNDFHGGAYLNFESLSSISREIRYMKENYDHVLALMNGDSLQGTAISNYYYGRPIIDVMNSAGFDGFTIGNHEFDWGIEKIGTYNDENIENGEAEFPILAANIVYKDTNEPLEFTKPYLISEVNGVRVGVIGVIGNVINSIAASRVENIRFLDPIGVIEDYTYKLRTEENVDIVVVYLHSGSDINYDIARLSGNYKVDAIFNGHTHANETGTIDRIGSDLVYAQASANKYALMAKIKLTYDTELQEIVFAEASTLSSNSLSTTDSQVNQIIYLYQNNPEYLDFVNEVLSYSVGNFYREDLGVWGASVIRDYLGIDIGAVNYGGFRTPIYQGIVTMGDLVTVYPFDNVIKTSRMTGQQIIDFYLDYPYDVAFDDGLSTNGYTVFINDTPLDPDKYYTVGAVDYIFDKQEFDFLDGLDITNTEQYMRDLLVMDLLNSNNSFNPYHGSYYTEPLSYFYEEIFVSIL